MRKAAALLLVLVMLMGFALPAYAAEASYTITVKVVSVKVVSNQSVGKSWSHKVNTMGKTLTAGKSYKAKLKASGGFELLCTSTEKDSNPDVGTLKIPVQVSALKTGTTTYTKTVTVLENAGRYKGNAAVWKYTITVTKAKAK